MLSIVVPVYNEVGSLGEVLAVLVNALPEVAKQIIVVDDGSDDGTRAWLRDKFSDGARVGVDVGAGANGKSEIIVRADAPVSLEVIFHARNQGKGAALRSGFAKVDGDIVVIQDADHEYDPADWREMYGLIAERGVADVVYGSRFYGRSHRSLRYHHYLANRVISLLFSICCNQKLTDVETCYKMMTRDVLRSLRLTADDYGIEIEMSAQIVRQRHLRIYETGISYYGRTHAEGKKINWTDGLKAIWYIFKFRYAR